MSARETLGQQLIREGLLSPAQVQAALSAQLQFDGRLGTNLIELGFLTEAQLTEALGRQHCVPSANDDDLRGPSQSVLNKLPARAATNFRAVPLRFDPQRPNCLRVAMANPGDLRALDDLGAIVGCRVQALAISELRLGQLLEKYYGVARPARMFVRVLTDSDEELSPSEAQGYGAQAPCEAKPAKGRPKVNAPPAELSAESRFLTPPPLPLEGAVQALRASNSVPNVAEPPRRGRPALHDVLSKFAQRSSVEEPRLADLWLTPANSRSSREPARLAPVGELEFEPKQFDYADGQTFRLTLAPTHSLPPAVAARCSAEGEFDFSAEPLTLAEPTPAAREAAARESVEPAPWEPASARADAVAVAADGLAAVDPSPVAASPLQSERVRVLPTARHRYSLEQILEQLSATDDRDLAANRVLAYLAQSFACGLILVVRQDVAYGWKGFAPNATDEQIESIVVPLSAPSLFRQVFTTGHPFRGAPPEGGERIHARLWKLLQCERPSEVLLTPVHVEGRLVNLIYAQPEALRRVKPVAQSHLVQLASATGLAYRRAIRRTVAAAAAG